MGLLRFCIHSSRLLQHALSCRCNGDLWVYCPGLLTALTVYPPLYYFLSRLAYREGLLSSRAGLWALAVAGVFRVAEVSHNVFNAW